MRTPARTITESDIAVFTALAGDAGGSVVSGLHILAVSVGLMFLAGERGIPRSTIALWGIERARFTAPARAGDTIHVDAEVIQTTLVDADRGLIAMTQRMTNQRGEELLTFTSKILVGRRRASEG